MPAINTDGHRAQRAAWLTEQQVRTVIAILIATALVTIWAVLA